MNVSLKPWNTFGIDRYANRIVCANSVEHIFYIWKKAIEQQQPVLVLGEGSNVLFLDDFKGTVIINRIMGITVTENNNFWYLHVGAGENWHNLVKFTIKNNIPGLENLALIPGRAGSSLIQNISAYGVEFKQICQYFDCIELNTGNHERMEARCGCFGYRDSIFKHEYQDKFIITAIGLKLSKHWKPLLNYGDLVYLDYKQVTSQQVFNVICRIRMTKLPDPKLIGNAGSFFKNPIISYNIAQELISQYPDIPYYLQDNGNIKIAAGWLIDQCKLKGISYGGAAIYRHQALVLINKKNATSQDIICLAHLVRQCVGEKFNVWLEPEVRFISSKGEVNAVETIT